MNTVVTSKEAILQVCRELIRQQGWAAVSIRSVANACGISVGSIYNYFDNKSQLLGAAVASVWEDIFHIPTGQTPFASVEGCVVWIFEAMARGNETYPNFFSMHSVGFLGTGKEEGQRLMAGAWEHMQQSIVRVIAADPKVRPDAFDPAFSPEDFAGILFSLLLSALVRQDFDSTAVVSLVRRVLY